MKIYFSGSIRGGRQYKEIYQTLINHLRKYGQVLSEHVGNPSLTSKGENLPKEYIYRRDMSMIRESDVFIAEVSSPSHSVGYEIRDMEILGKNHLLLFHLNNDYNLTGMFSGNQNLNVKRYNTIEDAKKHIDKFFTKLKQNRKIDKAPEDI